MTTDQLDRPHASAPGPGSLLRKWRQARRLSQLELAIQADISTRHLSFVETGRSSPSRGMILRLAEHLDLPLRESNQLLLAAGFAPVYSESPLDAPELAPVRDVVRRILAGHDPYPAVVVDRWWNLVDATESVGLLIGGAAEELLEPPVNVIRLTLHPRGMAPVIENLAEWRAHLLDQTARQIELTGDERLKELLAEVRRYPAPDGTPFPDAEPDGRAVPGEGPAYTERLPAASPVPFAVPLCVRPAGSDRTLSFVATIATFGTPVDVTVAELVIEAFYPADEATALALRDLAG